MTLAVPSSMRGGELSEPHQLSVPKGWKASVWARPEGARMMAITPEGNAAREHARRRRGARTLRRRRGRRRKGRPRRARIAAGPRLRQARRRMGPIRRGVGRDRRLSVARARARSGRGRCWRRTCPTKSPRATTSTARRTSWSAPDGEIYFDVGSSSNASPADRGYDPPRGVIDSVGPDGGEVKVVMRGVRNGEGLAPAPDGTVWTAINDRDEIPYPFHGASRRRRRSLRRSDPRLRRRPPGRRGGAGEPGTRPRLAALQPRTGRTRRPARSPTCR